MGCRQVGHVVVIDVQSGMVADALRRHSAERMTGREMRDNSTMQRLATLRTVLALFLMAMTLAGNALAMSSEELKAGESKADQALGRGDYVAAFRLYLPLANEGLADAQFAVGWMYTKGKGVPQDYAEAVKWLRKAADQGDASAQSQLGWMYEAPRGKGGKGISQNHVEAYKWYDLAASHYPASAKGKSKRAAKSRDKVAAKMTPQQIAEAQKLARDWKPTK